MRIGVISDTHITGRGQCIPDEILRDFKDVDMVLHAGDIGCARALEILRAVCPVVKAVRGNMDPDELKVSLPEKEIIRAGKFKIGLTHGAGSPQHLKEYVAALFKGDVVDAIVFGHSHVPCNETKNGILFFNPGSPTDTMFSPYNSYGILDAGERISGRIIKL